jgi:type IV secretory pathway VirB10-like protein
VSDERAFDEPLPWLAPVDDDDEPRGISARKMLAALVVVLLAALIVAATFFWIGRRNAAANGPPESETAFETSAGEDKNAQLDLGKLPEAPVAKPVKEQPQTIPANETKEPVAPEPKPSGPPGSVVQLGAFANQAQAERAWTALSTRFPSVAALNKTIVPFSGGIRLRAVAASPADAKQVCQTLRAAGENCFVP